MNNPIQPPRFKFEPDYVSPLGETLREIMEYHSVSIDEMAKKSGLSREDVAGILDGKTAITADMARGIARVFGVPASFWLRREEMYREGIKRDE